MAKKAFEVTATAAALNVVGMSLDWFFWNSYFHTTPVWHVVSLGVSVALLAQFALRRSDPPPAVFSAWTFVFHNVAIVAALWFVDTRVAVLPRQSATFQPQKLGALTVALLAPPNAQAAVASILLFVGSSLVRYELFDAETKAKLASEPWALVAYGIFGLVLYFYRMQSRKVRAEMERAQSEATSLERLSMVLLAFRDFYNTPLQTLELTIAILKRRCPEARDLAARMERATNRLAELNRIASSYDVPSRGIHPVSLDAADVLARRGRS
jgi:hypothetical protein